MRPIDADDLLWCYKKRMDFERHRNHAYLKGVRDCIKELEYQPTIEPERKKGRWINAADTSGGDYYRCSECGTYIEKMYFANDYMVNFCPNCGAEMGEDR